MIDIFTCKTKFRLKKYSVDSSLDGILPDESAGGISVTTQARVGKCAFNS